MNIAQFEVLAAIVDKGSITEAAESVGLTQSAVSSSLTKLETELGVRLLERGRGGIKLTRIGENVLSHARIILQQVEVIRQETMNERGLVVGKVRFGCIPQIPARLLTGIIQDFQSRYPGIEVVLFQGSSIEVQSWLENRLIDVGTVPESTGFPSVVPLAMSEIHVLLAASHPLARQERIDLHDVLKEPLIGSRSDIEAVRMMFQSVSSTPLHIRHQITEFNTVYAMVAEGWGIALLPSILVDHNLQNVVSRPLNPPSSMQAFLAASLPSPSVNAFLSCASTWSQGHGFWAELV